MEKYLKYFLSVVLFFAVLSCSKQIDENYKKNLPEYSPEMIGKLHNEFLEILDNQLLLAEDYKTIDEFSDLQIKMTNEIYFTRFNKNFEKHSHVEELIINSNKSVYYSAKSQTKSQTEANDELAKVLLKECDELLKNENFVNSISKKEVLILKEIISSFQSYELTKDLETLKTELKAQKDIILFSNFDPKTTDGYLAEMTISVAENSIQYWTEDSITKYGANSKIVWWAVSDAVGAIIGAGGAIIKDTLNEEDIDWTDVAVDGLIGGLGASIPGGKGFKKLIKKIF
jgi:hypothetical protein